ncbi:glycosyltransferase [Microbacterium soli]|uniref:Glycosyltransferase n=1 Tax=Microbacterium soli TaxID=446075 RepID=A0ABP7MPB2_9MICO
MRLWKHRSRGPEPDEVELPLLHPERIVAREYYGAVLGIRFADDREAAEHYLADGWRSGVVPHPFLDFAMVRSSMDAAVTLRDALREFASTAEAHAELGGAGPLIDGEELSKTGMVGAADDIALLLRQDAATIDAVPLRGGSTWAQAREFFASTQGVAERLRDAGFLDQDFYGRQRPRPFLTWHAALDDYLVVGERSGAIPNWAFEPEWHAAHDAAQQRGVRPVNQLLWYVDQGEQTSTSPLGDGADGRPLRLEEILNEPADALMSGARPAAVTWGEARNVVADSFPVKPMTAPPRRAPLRGRKGVDVAVIVDARHLATEANIADLHRLARSQRTDGRTIYIVSDAADGHEPPLAVRFEDEERVQVVSCSVGEPFGAVAVRVIQDGAHEAWTLWRPGQVWKDDGLIATARALDGYPEAAGVGAHTPAAPQDWGDPQGALWRARLDAAGIIFRSSRITPDPARDFGANADAVYRLGETGTGVVIEGDRFWARGYDAQAHANRAGANSARASHSSVPESTLPEGIAVTVIVPTFEDWRMTLEAVRAVRATSDAGVIVIDNGSRRAVGAILRSAFLGDRHVQYVRLARNADFAAGSHLGARMAQSEYLVFLNNDTIVQPGWLGPLIGALKGAVAAQPVLTFADGTVQAAGTVFSGGLSMPAHVLAGYHPADLPERIGEYDFSALTGACLAVRREHYVEVGGFDAEYVNGMEDIDLSLKLKSAAAGPLRVVTESRVRHLESRTPGRFRYAMPNRVRFAQRWRAELLESLDDRAILDGTPLRLDRVIRGEQRGGILREVSWQVTPRESALEISERPERLRWALKIPSPGTLLGDRWGDTFFAEDLATALRGLGQQVVIDRRSSWERSGAEYDDVNLVLRGIHAFTPLAPAVNLMWVISHPDQVSIDELSYGWDRVYSAGPRWAEETARRAGIRIETLLQATDPDRFRPSDRDDAPREGVLFVGRTRGERRRVVVDAARVAEDLEVYGDDGWEQHIDRRFIRGQVMPNQALPQAYRRARVVLNDHWDDMRRGGFVSNRLFDAVASGVRVVSDEIDGLAEIFGAQVRTYTSEDELRELLSPAAQGWPSESESRRAAERIRAEHSFQARARVLLDDAMRARSARSAL